MGALWAHVVAIPRGASGRRYNGAVLEPLTVLVTRWTLAFDGPSRPLDPVVLRGALLLQYRRMVCPRERWNDPCDSCPHLEGCSYAEVFAARPAQLSVLRRNATVPRPYVFRPEARRPGTFLLVLAGRASALLPRIVNIFTRLGPRGLRAGEPPFRVVRITEVLPDGERPLDPEGRPSPLPLDLWVPADNPGELVIRFTSPTSIASGGKPVGRPLPGPVVRRMRDRLSALAAAWCGSPPGWDFRRIGRLADSIVMVEERTRWVRRRRTSGRTGESYSLSGFVGEAHWRDIPAELHPIIAGCRLVGVGKRCAFGNGAFEILRPWSIP